MQIEFSKKTQEALERAAAAAGMSVSQLANLLVEEQLTQGTEAAARRQEAIDTLIDHMKTAGGHAGRDGRPWRDFIHEGHTR